MPSRRSMMMYEGSDSRVGEKELYGIARQSDRAEKNVQYIGLIKDRILNVRRG